MGLFSFYRRHFTKDGRKWARYERMDRVDYLLAVSKDLLEEPKEAFGGLNFLQLVDRQLDEGQIDLALSNMSRQPDDAFRIANLHWGKGDLVTAKKYLRLTLALYRKFAAAKARHRHEAVFRHFGEAYIKAAAILLDEKLEGPVLASQHKPGYQPAFENYLLDCCRGAHAFDLQYWQELEDAWLKNRFPKYKLAEYAVYVKALTGEFDDDAAMLKAHERMWRGKAKRSPDAGLLEGYSDNELIVDYLFAAILQRIGWQGTYRHSWPGSCPVGTAPETTRPADRFVDTVEGGDDRHGDEAGAVIEDPAAARAYIDAHVPGQRDWWEGKHFDPMRPLHEREQVAGRLAAIGWEAEDATLDLMRTYRMDAVLNDSTHIFLSDPVGDRYCSLENWTGLFVDEFGMSPEFIAIAESEEKTDYRDPQGGWYVLWKKDHRIYAVQRDEWGDPRKATAKARLGKELWPNYPSFVAWWVAQHQEGERDPAPLVVRAVPPED